MDLVNLVKNNNTTKEDVQDEEFYLTEDYPQQPSNVLIYLLRSILLIVIFAICIRLFYKDSYLKAVLDGFTILVSFTAVLATGSIILRIINFFAELEHLKTEYNGQVIEVLKAAFDFNILSIILIIFCGFSIIALKVQYKSFCDFNEAFNITSLLLMLASVILCQTVDLFRSTSGTAHEFNALDGVDYGTGMACSYFYGYLRIILPSNGSQNPGIRAKMEWYEGDQNVTIPVKKLFILIPASGYIPPDLRDASDNWLEGTTALWHEIRDRAGTKRRTYKNTVYKIHPGGEGSLYRPVYITVEGATPMLTLYEIIKHSHKQTATYRRNRNKIVAAFYHSLQELLDSDPDCRNICELIYYNDYVDNKKVNVGEILLNRIRKEAPTCC